MSLMTARIEGSSSTASTRLMAGRASHPGVPADAAAVRPFALPESAAMVVSAGRRVNGVRRFGLDDPGMVETAGPGRSHGVEGGAGARGARRREAATGADHLDVADGIAALGTPGKQLAAEQMHHLEGQVVTFVQPGIFCRPGDRRACPIRG